MNLVSRDVSTGTDAPRPTVVVDLAADGSVPAGFVTAARAAARDDALLRARLPHPSATQESPTSVVADVHLRAVASAAVRAALSAAGVEPRWSLEAGTQ